MIAEFLPDITGEQDVVGRYEIQRFDKYSRRHFKFPFLIHYGGPVQYRFFVQNDSDPPSRWGHGGQHQPRTPARFLVYVVENGVGHLIFEPRGLADFNNVQFRVEVGDIQRLVDEAFVWVIYEIPGPRDDEPIAGAVLAEINRPHQALELAQRQRDIYHPGWGTVWGAAWRTVGIRFMKWSAVASSTDAGGRAKIGVSPNRPFDEWPLIPSVIDGLPTNIKSAERNRVVVTILDILN